MLNASNTLGQLVQRDLLPGIGLLTQVDFTLHQIHGLF